MGTKYRGNEDEVSALNIYIKMIRATDAVVAKVQRPILDSGLSASQFGVIEALYHLGPMNQATLGRKILKSSGNMTMVINNLEKRGLARRSPNRNDKRSATIHLTEEGKNLVENILPNHVERINLSMNVLSFEQKQILESLLKRLGYSQSDVFNKNS